MVAAYEAGVTMKDLATALGVHRNTVSDLLRKNGVSIRRRGLNPQDIPGAAQLYEEGWSSLALGEKFGVDPHTVLTALRKTGVRVRPRSGGRPPSLTSPEPDCQGV